MKKIVQNRMVTVKVVGMLGTRALVELVDESVAPPVSTSKALLDSGFAIEEKDTGADKGGSMHTASGKYAESERVWARISGELAGIWVSFYLFN